MRPGDGAPRRRNQRELNVLDPVDDRWPTLPGDSPSSVAGSAAVRRSAGRASQPWEQRPRPLDAVEDRWPALPGPIVPEVEPGAPGEEARLRRLAHEQEGVPWSEWPF
jgi:hypothetical protein